MENSDVVNLIRQSTSRMTSIVNNTSEIVVVDCTLRDGGYYNSWDFPRSLVQAYLRSLGESGVNILEVGFRSLNNSKYLGPFAYSTDDYLQELPWPVGMRLAVMVNAHELLDCPSGASAAVDLLFREAGESRVGLVRIATHPTEAGQCGAIIGRLKEKGYDVSLNLMQVSGLAPDELGAQARAIAALGGIDVLYLADSLGNMTPQTMRVAIEAVRSGWDGRIGIHAHDNRGQALANSLTALEAGASWVDATVLGMGRGSGNARTEHLLLELEQRRPGSYNPEAVFPLVLDEFEALRENHRWGYNLFYYLSAFYGVHPTYVQEMLGGARYHREHILDVLRFLRDSQSSVYSEDQFRSALSDSTLGTDGEWDATGWCQDREVLILGSGPSLADHLDAIGHYIDRRRPVVVCLNVKEFVPRDKVDVYAACHSARLVLEVEEYASLQRPLIIPLGSVPLSIRRHLERTQIHDYGVKLQAKCFEARSNHCVLPSSLAFGYGVAVACAGGARRILLAGFDGYSAGDPRQIEMVEVLECYARFGGAVQLVSVTPTTYPVQQSSIYSPWL